MSSLGLSSRYFPPNEWLFPVEKLVNDALCVPATLASAWRAVHVNPYGGSHLHMASGSRKALYPRWGGAINTRCKRTVPGMAFLLVELVASPCSRTGGEEIDSVRSGDD